MFSLQIKRLNQSKCHAIPQDHDCYFADEKQGELKNPTTKKTHTERASIRPPFPSTGSTVKSGHGTFPLPQLCVYLSQPLSVLQDLTWEDTHMPSNCLPDGAAFSPAPRVLISCTCGRLWPLVPLSFLSALSIHAFFSLHIHVSIHP